MPKNGRARRGGRKGWRQGEGKREREGWLSQGGDKCLYCSNAGAREKGVNEMKGGGVD